MSTPDEPETPASLRKQIDDLLYYTGGNLQDAHIRDLKAAELRARADATPPQECKYSPIGTHQGQLASSTICRWCEEEMPSRETPPTRADAAAACNQSAVRAAEDDVLGAAIDLLRALEFSQHYETQTGHDSFTCPLCGDKPHAADCKLADFLARVQRREA